MNRYVDDTTGPPCPRGRMKLRVTLYGKWRGDINNSPTCHGYVNTCFNPQRRRRERKRKKSHVQKYAETEEKKIRLERIREKPQKKRKRKRKEIKCAQEQNSQFFYSHTSPQRPSNGQTTSQIHPSFISTYAL